MAISLAAFLCWVEWHYRFYWPRSAVGLSGIIDFTLLCQAKREEEEAVREAARKAEEERLKQEELATTTGLSVDDFLGNLSFATTMSVL